MSSEETYERVESGRKWLAKEDSDPPGRFYLWYKAGVRRVHQKHFSEEVRAETQKRYDQWVKALKMWINLYEKLEREVEAEYPKSAWEVADAEGNE